MTNDIADFCREHAACDEGRDWALSNCHSLSDAWDRLKPNWLVWAATRRNMLDDGRLRLFACFCARQNLTLLTGKTFARYLHAVRDTERFVKGHATDRELAAAKAIASHAQYTTFSTQEAITAAWAVQCAVCLVNAADAAWCAATNAWSASDQRAFTMETQAEYLRAGGNPFD